MDDRVAETIAVTYNNREHQAYTELLMANGFTFSVLPNFTVGLEYENKGKQLKLRLEEAEEDDRAVGFYEAKLFFKLHGKWTVPMYPEHYSLAEWNFITDNDTANRFQIAEREVYIWVKVRPHSLNTQARIDTV